MKKLSHLIFSLCVVGLAQNGFSQDQTYKRTIAIGSGPNVCKFTDRNDKAMVGLGSTFTYQKFWAKWIGYRIGANYDQKGNKEYATTTGKGSILFDDKYPVTVGVAGDNIERKIQATYLTLPINLELNFKFRKFGFHGFGGFFMAAMLNQNITYTVDGTDETQVIDKTKFLVPADIGFTFGSGSSYALTPRLKTRAEVVFYYGLLPMGRQVTGRYITQCISTQATFVYSFNTKEDKAKLAEKE